MSACQREYCMPGNAIYSIESYHSAVGNKIQSHIPAIMEGGDKKKLPILLAIQQSLSINYEWLALLKWFSK